MKLSTKNCEKIKKTKNEKRLSYPPKNGQKGLKKPKTREIMDRRRCDRRKLSTIYKKRRWTSRIYPQFGGKTPYAYMQYK